MEIKENKGRVAFDLLLSLDDASFSTANLAEFYILIKNVLCEFLGVKNFYVAHLDEDKIQYPLAVTNQQVVYWEDRFLENRLTDKVILEGKSIFLTQDADEFVSQEGLGNSNLPLSAWMGVPLIIQEKSIGCLSVFSYEEGFSFDEIDEILFSLVAAKVSSRLEISKLATTNAEYLERLYSKQQIETVLDSVSGGVIFVESSGYVSITNRVFREMAEMEDGEDAILFTELPMRVFELLSCDVKDVEHWLEQASNQIEVTDHKSSYRVQDSFYQRDLASVVFLDEIVGISFVVNDISDQIFMQETRSLISSTIVHDLRSPMSAVISAILLMNEVLPEGFENPIYNQAFEIAQRNVQRVINLVESLLDISKLESGRMQLYIEEFDLSDVIEELILEQKTRADFMNVCIRTDFKGRPFFVKADRNMLQRVILNLLDNALKFSSENDEVLFSLRKNENNNIELRVEDQGPGIADDQKQRIFEQFIQVSADDKPGAGLGLTFCRLAVEAHKGEIFVEDREGGGAIFVVNIPSTEGIL